MGNPHKLLSTIPSGISHFSVLELKDAFCSFLLDAQSQTLFPLPGLTLTPIVLPQLHWTVLPQGFRDSPHLFCPKSNIIHYIDDILLYSASVEISQAEISALLNFLSSWGYRISPSKIQLSTPQVTYLGLTITPNHNAIIIEKYLILSNNSFYKGRRDFCHS